MEPLDRLLVESQCTQLCFRFAHHLDSGNFEAMISLFTEDGLFDRVGQILRGHDEMRAAFRDRPRGLTTRHVVTNVHFLEVQPKRAEAHIYNMSYHASDAEPDKPAIYATVNGRFIDFHDHYQLTPHGWRFLSRQARVIFISSDWDEPRRNTTRGTPAK